MILTKQVIRMGKFKYITWWKSIFLHLFFKSLHLRKSDQVCRMNYGKWITWFCISISNTCQVCYMRQTFTDQFLTKCNLRFLLIFFTRCQNDRFFWSVKNNFCKRLYEKMGVSDSVSHGNTNNTDLKIRYFVTHFSLLSDCVT